MRPIASGFVLASLVVTASAFAVAPAKAGDYWYGGGQSYVSYSSSCCYQKLTKKVVTYQRVRHYDYGGYQQGYYGGYQQGYYGVPRYRRSYSDDGYYGRPYGYRSYYGRPYSYTSYRDYDDGYYRRPYRYSSYPTHHYDDGYRYGYRYRDW